MTKLMQGRSVRGAAAVLLATTVTGLALLAAGCGDNSGNPTDFAPEGQVSPAILLLDVQPFTADTSQVFVLALVASPPPADGFRFYVNPDGQGYRTASDSPLPSSTTFDSGWSFFQTSLDGYDPTTMNLWVKARGARGGVESSYGPLTPEAFVPRSDALTLARRQTVTQQAPPDSAMLTGPTFAWQGVFQWAPVPGAGSYLLQAVNITSGELGLLVHVPASGATPTELENSVQDFVPYLWFVSAYDTGGRAIGVSGTRVFQYIPPSTASAALGMER